MCTNLYTKLFKVVKTPRVMTILHVFCDPSFFTRLFRKCTLCLSETCVWQIRNISVSYHSFEVGDTRFFTLYAFQVFNIRITMTGFADRQVTEILTDPGIPGEALHQATQSIGRLTKATACAGMPSCSFLFASTSISRQVNVIKNMCVNSLTCWSSYLFIRFFHLLS